MEHPILFSSEMVRAILDGRKTQMRRVIKPQPFFSTIWENGYQTDYCEVEWDNKRYNDDCGEIEDYCPYGKPGDTLWVRESFSMADRGTLVFSYRATEEHPQHYKYRPSIHMPRWASRLTLEIVSVRVERVQSISDDDALAEGVDRTNARIVGCPKERFHRLWDSINGKRNGDAYAWDKNPYVWVIEFRRI